EAVPASSLAAVSTTIGQSAGQATPRARRRAWLLATGMTGVMVMGLFIYVLRNTVARGPPSRSPAAGKAAQPALRSASGPAAKPAPQLVHWRIESEPDHASVVDNSGRVVGATPWVHEQEISTGSAEYTLSLAGYADAAAKLDRASDSTKKLVLVRKP